MEFRIENINGNKEWCCSRQKPMADTKLTTNKQKITQIGSASGEGVAKSADIISGVKATLLPSAPFDNILFCSQYRFLSTAPSLSLFAMAVLISVYRA